MQFGTIEVVIYLVANFLRLYLVNLFMRSVLLKEAEEAHKKTLRPIVLLLYYTVNSAGFLVFHFSPSMNLLVNMTGMLLLAFTYDGKTVLKIFAAIASMVLTTICEDAVISIILYLKIEEIFIIGLIATDILFYMIILLIGKAVDLKRGVRVPAQEWAVVLTIPLLTLFISIVILGHKENHAFVAFGEISLVLIDILVFVLLNKIQKMYNRQLEFKLMEQQKEAYEQQMQFYQEAEERIHGLRHDMKNHFIAIQELAKEDHSERVAGYVQKLSDEVGKTKHIVSTGNVFIDSFLNYKLLKIRELGAEIETDITISKDLEMDPKDISILFGNLLDNAITAIGKCEGDKKLSFTMKQNPGNLFIRIANTFQDEIQRSGNKFQTTKEEKSLHGYGIENVKRLVKEYNGSIDFSVENQMFEVRLIIYKK